jgi:hypothetical protein
MADPDTEVFREVMSLGTDVGLARFTTEEAAEIPTLFTATTRKFADSPFLRTCETKVRVR